LILKSLTPRNFGPFSRPSTLKIDPEVTVITGCNDVGKSAALDVIRLICSRDAAPEGSRNLDRIGHHSGAWNDDPEFVCEAEFEISAYSKPHVTRDSVNAGDQIKVKVKLGQAGHNYEILEVRPSRNKSDHLSFKIKQWPQIVRLPLAHNTRQTIDLVAMNDAENALIRLGLGPNFSAEHHIASSPITRTIRLGRAKQILNDRLKEMFPPQLPFQFDIHETAGDASKLTLILIDAANGGASITSRGAGIQRLLSLMGALLNMTFDTHSIVLFDEPETSLHADAQHVLRRTLERLAKHPCIQVVYCTHSSAMINGLRPGAVRLVDRLQDDGIPTSRFHNDVYRENFVHVRSSLGLSPADSLLYAPITIVLEGATEVLCLPLLLEKLANSNILDGDTLRTMLSQSHVVDGLGSSVQYVVTLAKSQGAHPVVFLDGDKANEAARIRSSNPDVAVIELPRNTEFENIVPLKDYLQAASLSLPETVRHLVTPEAFEVWQAGNGIPEQMMISKRVDRWISDVFNANINKPATMAKAIELADATSITAAPFIALLDAMERIGHKL
jgi:predicted ATPase